MSLRNFFRKPVAETPLNGSVSPTDETAAVSHLILPADFLTAAYSLPEDDTTEGREALFAEYQRQALIDLQGEAKENILHRFSKANLKYVVNNTINHNFVKDTQLVGDLTDKLTAIRKQVTTINYTAVATIHAYKMVLGSFKEAYNEMIEARDAGDLMKASYCNYKLNDYAHPMFAFDLLLSQMADCEDDLEALLIECEALVVDPKTLHFTTHANILNIGASAEKLQNQLNKYHNSILNLNYGPKIDTQNDTILQDTLDYLFTVFETYFANLTKFQKASQKFLQKVSL